MGESFCASRARSQKVQMPRRGSHWSQSQGAWKIITSHLVWEQTHCRKLGRRGRIYSVKRNRFVCLTTAHKFTWEYQVTHRLRSNKDKYLPIYQSDAMLALLFNSDGQIIFRIPGFRWFWATTLNSSDVSSTVSELCQSGREWIVPLFPKWSFIMQKAGECAHPPSQH